MYGKLDTQKLIFSMPPTVISPTLLSGPRYDSDMVLESTETTQSNNHSICSPSLQWFYMPFGQSNESLPVSIYVHFFCDFFY